MKTGSVIYEPKGRALELRPTAQDPGDAWQTPEWLFDMLHQVFDFTLDVCAEPHNAKCLRYFTPEDDGLKQPWTGRIWMNPPYSRVIEKWVAKAAQSAASGRALVVGLLPVRTGAAWWQEHVTRGHVHFLRGRLKFGTAKSNAPFDSALVIWWPRPEGCR